MDQLEHESAGGASACVASIQKQIKRLSEELPDGQHIEAQVLIAGGAPIVATSFGYQNPELIRITGVDNDGNEVCVLMHMTSLQVVLRRVLNHPSQPSITFPSGESKPSEPNVFDQTA